MAAERIRFVVPGPPRGKGRPNAARRKKKDGKTYIAMIPAEKTVSYESLVKHHVAHAMVGRLPLDGEVAIEVIATFSIPKSLSKAKREMCARDKIRPTSKPDSDNLLKIICDGMNEIAYRDDAQVVRAVVIKRYGEVPGVEVTFHRWEPL